FNSQSSPIGRRRQPTRQCDQIGPEIAALGEPKLEVRRHGGGNRTAATLQNPAAATAAGDVHQAQRLIFSRFTSLGPFLLSVVTIISPFAGVSANSVGSTVTVTPIA